jgi:hypothetical protein
MANTECCDLKTETKTLPKRKNIGSLSKFQVVTGMKNPLLYTIANKGRLTGVSEKKAAGRLWYVVHVTHKILISLALGVA